jgi:hypothetical protein
MAKKLLPSEYLGSDYSVSSSKMLINPVSLTSGGLTVDEIAETSVPLTTGGALTAGLTYTVTTAQTGAAPTLAEWNTMGWNGTAVPVLGDTFTALTTGVVAATGSVVVKSGDVRRILFGIVEAAYQKYLTYTTAGTAPAKMSIARTSSVNDATGVLTRFYTLTFVTDISAVEISEE